MRGMVINMEEAKLQTLVQIKAFLDGTSGVVFRIPKEERNQFIGRILKRFGYAPHGRVDKGVLLRYIERMTGLSRQQVTRLVRQYRKDGKLSKQPCTPKQGFTYRCGGCVTQMQFIATCEKISEAYLLPVIRQLLDGFPFVILGFHSDNGSEYINYTVAKLLEKLRVEFTKSRPRHSNDNALAESKNAAVVRKHLGYAHIPQFCASLVNAFCADFLNPYVNFHRPCFFPETITYAKGKERKKYRYEDMMTPYEKLKSIPEANQYLKVGITLEQLNAQAVEMSDNDAALVLNSARKKLFREISAAMKKQA